MRLFYLSTALSLTALHLSSQALAQTATIPTGQTLIYNGNSQKCMDDPYSTQTAGTKIQQYVCTDNPNQKWNFVKANNGGTVTNNEAMIRSPLSKLCLAPAGGSKDPQAEIVFASCDIKNSSLVWTIKANGNQFSFTNKTSTLCLGVKDQSGKDEARLVQITCGNNPGQLWGFAKKAADVGTNATGGGKPTPNPNGGNGGTVGGGGTGTNGAGGNGAGGNGAGAGGNGNGNGGNPTPPTNTKLSTTGKWSAPFDLGLSATSMAVIANGKVLIWPASGTTAYGGGQTTQMMLFDPATDRKAKIITTSKGPMYRADSNHEYFCEGTTILANGGVMATGGYIPDHTSMTDPNGNWTASSPLNIARGYTGSTLTSNGQVFTLGGSWSGGSTLKLGELYTPGVGWKLLKNVSPQDFWTNDEAGQYRADNHMWLFGASNGWVFHAGPSKKMHCVNTSGDGSVAAAGTRGNDNDAMNGNAVMYDINKILAVNGSANYDDDRAPSSNATLIDLSKGPGASVTTRTIANLKFARKFGHSIVLPNGQVMIVGGAGQGNHPFFDTAAVMTPELWDPVTEKSQTQPNHATPRTYHSIGFLTVDGRVMIAGGGLGADTRPVAKPQGQSVHLDAEIFTPPYLLNADGTDAVRPTIVAAPASTSPGQTISVTSNGATNFVLIRVSSDTHSLNNDQRRIPLAIAGNNTTKMIKASNTRAADSTTSLKIPDDRGIVIPGTYYLFALDDNGTPSIASMINIQ